MRLTFLGATGTVTGSRYLVETGGARILVDSGLFQGFKQLRLRNWAPLPVDPKSLTAVLLTHAHLDHTGYLPRLVRGGFRGPVYCTAATAALLGILLPDSGHLQEEEARYAEKRGYSKHRPAEPLYTEEEARDTLKLLRSVDWRLPVTVAPGLTAEWIASGHILGAASIVVRGEHCSLGFSGDVGRMHDALMREPQVLPPLDALVVESTYGDRSHPVTDPQLALSDAIRTVARRGGVLLIPAFAVGRTQLLMHYLAQLQANDAIPRLPAYLNSPMATDVSGIYHTHRTEHRLSAADCDAMCRSVHYVNSVEESQDLNRRHGPMIILSASGMATGGRVLHHLRAFGPDERSMVLLAGYQASGTRGAALAGGARQLRIHGVDVPINAEVRQLPAMSGHADADELIAWLAGCGPPSRVFISHGEPAAADALRQRIERRFGWPVDVPQFGEAFDVSAHMAAVP